MPSAFAHAAVGAALASAWPNVQRRHVVAACLGLAAAAPDLDVIGHRLGIAYADPLGHRGLTHSLVFAIAVGVASVPLWRHVGAGEPRLGGALLALALASHGLLDMFTDAGLGIGLFIPFDDMRYAAPFRPLATSPLSVRAFFSWRGLEILANELVWIGPVVLATAVAGSMARRRAAAG